MKLKSHGRYDYSAITERKGLGNDYAAPHPQPNPRSFVGHGRTNAERQADLPLEAERQLIREAADTIEKHEGKRPLGRLAPYISQTPASPDLLREAGFRYLMDWPLDDQPVWFRTSTAPSSPSPTRTTSTTPSRSCRGARPRSSTART